MANNNYSLVITIRSGAKKKSGDVANGDSEDGNSEATKKATGEDISFQKVVSKVAGYYASTSLVRSMVKSEVGLIDVYTGNDYQQRVIESAINITESAISTTLAFSVNPVAGVMSLAQKAISYGAEARRKSVELYTQSLEAGMVRERAGGAFNRSRLAGRY